jgi:hypothetical protein
MRYSLIRDDDGNWFVFPADRRREIKKYFQQYESYWIGDREFEPTQPDGLKEIDDLDTLTFENPKDI